jgi:putative membrane protein
MSATREAAMHDPVKQFLSDGERARIEERVRLAEQRTSGEIVVMLVPSSSPYEGVVFVPAFVAALLLATPPAMFFGDGGMWVFLALQLSFFLLFSELFRRVPGLRRFAAGRAAMSQAVEAAAFAAFFLQGVHRTAGETGILLYISMFEHKVRVVADRGIDSRVPEGAWAGIVERLVEGIRAGRQGEAIVAAVDRFGELLESHCPPLPGDVDEIHNGIRSWKP